MLIWDWCLEPENIARIMPGRIMTVRFFPCTDVNMVATGNKFGNVAFWNVDSDGEGGNGIFLYWSNSWDFVPAILFFQGNFDVKFLVLPFHFFAKFEMWLYNGNICNLLRGWIFNVNK